MMNIQTQKMFVMFKISRVKNLAWDFWGVNFWSRDFLGFVGSPRDFLGF